MPHGIHKCTKYSIWLCHN